MVTIKRTVAPSTIPIGLWRWLCDLPWDPDQREGILLTFTCEESELWVTHRSAVISYFALQHPCERPSLFWQHEPLPPRRPGESDVAFLHRNNLLLPGELERRKNSK